MSFPVGADEWTLMVGARDPLVGEFAGLAPWIILGVGLLAAVLAAVVVETQARRSAYAEATVEQRTAELEDTRGFLESLFASGPTAVMRFKGGAGSPEVVYASPNTTRVLGIDMEEILRSGRAEDWVHPDDRAVVAETATRARRRR